MRLQYRSQKMLIQVYHITFYLIKEISIKRVYPELSFEQLTKKNIVTNDDNIITKSEEPDTESNPEEIIDENLLQIIKKQTKLFKGVINRTLE